MNLEALRHGCNGRQIPVAVRAPGRALPVAHTPIAIWAVVAAVASHGGMAIPAVVDLIPPIEKTAVRSPA